jgi:tRNA modification GTPase
MPEDTITAIATAPGYGSISIIRISGKKSLEIADKIFVSKKPKPSERQSHTIIYGKIADDNTVIDEVLLLIMRAPQSYTKEDVVEIHCHGGAIPAKKILQTVIKNGARLAEPGEFTQRAFLNGRIDLVQAEGVLDLIKAETELSAKLAINQIEGKLSLSLSSIYENTLSVLGDIEFSLDFLEDEFPPSFFNEKTEKLTKINYELDKLLDSWQNGHFIKDGAVIVIAGKPNVGKSTLLNALLKKNRAIVSPIPGTTRDTIEETLLLDNYCVRLIDTAGIRESECPIEQEGVKRTKALLKKADFIIYIVDVVKGWDNEDELALQQFDYEHVILIFNKCDLINCHAQNTEPHKAKIVLHTSFIKEEDIVKVEDAIKSFMPSSYLYGYQCVISERHRLLLLEARDFLEESIKLISTNEPERVSVLIASNLHCVLEKIGTIIGRTYYQELLDSIFSKFCIGK